MPKVNPFVGLFVAIATLMTAFFVPVFVLLIDHGERLAAVEASIAAMRLEYGERLAAVEALQVEQGERLAAVETLLVEQGERLTRIEARFETRMNELDTRMDDLGATVAATNERMARIEGTVAGALGRPFPERMAEGPDNLAADG